MVLWKQLPEVKNNGEVKEFYLQFPVFADCGSGGTVDF